MAIMGVAKFERFFRAAGSVDVDKDDLKRYNEFLDHKIYDMFLIARNAANANGRDVIQPVDLPITKGLQESIHQFRKLDVEIEVRPLLEQLLARPALDIAISEETEAKLPGVAGGLSVALARSFRIIEPGRKNPATEQWERVFQIFDLLL
jgi:histone H3/H4